MTILGKKASPKVYGSPSDYVRTSALTQQVQKQNKKEKTPVFLSSQDF